MNEPLNEDYKKRWDLRYSESDFAYGKTPNLFFKAWLPKFTPGKILMAAEGEGRNGVYAAALGWDVTAFDLSEEGKRKAMELAAEQEVSLTYLVGHLDQLHFDKDSFDAIGLVYAHVEAPDKSAFHRKLDQYLKPGGLLLFEAFSKNHLAYLKNNPAVGGPKDPEMLFSVAELQSYFKNYEVVLLEEVEIELNEGNYHIGKGSVIRFVGRKYGE